MLVIDDTSFPKQGKASVGVARQYCGALGKRANCQVVVSAEYLADEPESSRPLHWPVSGRLYLPEGWANDRERREISHVPQEISFRIKPNIALSLVDLSREWEVPFEVVVADSGYGKYPSFLGGYSTLGAELSLERLASVAKSRWAIEQFYEDGKGECGLSDYQGRRWEGLHRHLALSMLAYSFLMLHSSITTSVGGSSSSGDAFFPLGQAHDASCDPQAGTGVAFGGPGAMVHQNREDQDLPSS